MAETFEAFAIVELFGHSRIAGKVTEQIIAGQGFLRVDVPTLPEQGPYPSQAGFTRMFGPGAIYSITPVVEEVAIQAAQTMRVAPVNMYIPAVAQLMGKFSVEKFGDADLDDGFGDEELDDIADEE